MSQPWRVLAWAGSYSWDERDDATAPSLPVPAPGRLVGPLTIKNSYPQSDVAPMVQPDATTASFRVIVADVAHLDQLQLGDPVTLRYFGSRTPAALDKPLVEFVGRVSDLKAEPSDLGMLFTVSCTDYTADLGELPVGTAAYPSENLDARVRRILADAGLNVPAGVALYGGTSVVPTSATVVARAASQTTALELLTSTCAQYRLDFAGFPTSLGLATVRQVTSPDSGVATFSSGAASLDNANGPFQIQDVFKAPTFAAPLRVQLVAGVYKLTATGTSGPGGVGLVDAGVVDMSTSFGQRKGDAVNSVAVTSDAWGQTIVSWSASAVIRATIETDLASATDGSNLAILYFPYTRPSQAALWVADSLRWLIDKEPGAWTLPPLGRGFMVARVKTVWSPLEREWYVGLLMARTFTVDDGVPSASLDTAPWNVDPTQASNPVKWSDLVGGMTYVNMSTRDTYNDYALAGI